MNIDGIVPKELIEHLIGNGIDKLDLVSRKEFIVQTKLLEKTRAKIDLLSKRLDEFEQTLEP